MKTVKGAGTGESGTPTEAQLGTINEFTKRELKAEDVFTFDLLLCDNEVDRDFERFTAGALRELEKLFIGKTGIFDHRWSAGGQKARIFAAETVTDASRTTMAGEPYAYLKASAYMLRTGENAELIAEIEGGIKRETSVGCSVGASECSICGEESGSGKCAHVKGREYGGRLCWAELSAPTDAYEWSFVAVPAQRNAGVLKKFGADAYGGRGDEELFKLAALGESYLKGLRGEVVRMGMLAKCGFEREALEKAAGAMEEKELLSFKSTFERRLDELLPPVSQLAAAKRAKPDFDGGEFLV